MIYYRAIIVFDDGKSVTWVIGDASGCGMQLFDKLNRIAGECSNNKIIQVMIDVLNGGVV